MLKQMRENVQSKFIKGLLWAVIASFVLGVFLIYGSGSETLEGNPDIVARVGDVELMRQDFSRRLQFYNRDETNKQAVAQAVTRVLQDFIREELWLQEAEDLGIEVTPRELFDEIMNYRDAEGNYVFRNAKGEFIGSDMYERRLSAARMSPVMFEMDLKRRLKLQKLNDLLIEGITVTDEEVLNFYKLQNEKVQVKLVKFDSADYENEITVDEANLKQYYEDNKENYRRPLQHKYEIAKVTLAKYKPEVEVQPEEVRKYYETHKEDFYEGEKRLGRHILFKVNPTDDAARQAEVREIAESILKQIKEEGADFAELATKHSEDTVSAANGGLLTYVPEGTYQKEFDKALFSMRVGEVRGLVRTSFGYHIIRLEGIEPGDYRKFADVRSEIIEKMKTFKAMDLRDREIDNIEDALSDADNWEEAAKKLQVEYSATDFTVPESVPRGVPYSENSMKEISQMSKEGEMTPSLVDGENITFVKLVQVRASHIPGFEEIKDTVEANYKGEQAATLAENRAIATLEKIKAGTPVEEAVAGTRANVILPEPVSRTGSIKDIGRLPALVKAMFEANNGEAAGPFDYYKGQLLAVREALIEIDYAEFTSQQETLKSQLLMQKKNNALMANLELLAKDADINTNEKLIQEYMQ